MMNSNARTHITVSLHKASFTQYIPNRLSEEVHIVEKYDACVGYLSTIYTIKRLHDNK